MLDNTLLLLVILTYNLEYLCYMYVAVELKICVYISVLYVSLVCMGV